MVFPAAASSGAAPAQATPSSTKLASPRTGFNQNNRFWYCNDLGGGKREFILVDAEDGTRELAFDHVKLAAALAKASAEQ